MKASRQTDSYKFSARIDNSLVGPSTDVQFNDAALPWTTPSLERIATNQPRTMGIDVKYKF